MPSDYPTANDLQSFLTKAGLYDANQSPDLDAITKAAKTAWERLTCWRPFLSSGLDESRIFVLQPYRAAAYLPRWATTRLYLRSGLLSVTSITSDGGTLTQDEDWGFLPAAGAQMEPPYTDIWLRGVSSPITITGKWGYCDTLTDDVWQIVLQAAAQMAFPQIELATTGGVQSVQTLTTKVNFGSGSGSTFSRTATGWDSIYRNAILDYKLIGLGG